MMMMMGLQVEPFFQARNLYLFIQGTPEEPFFPDLIKCLKSFSASWPFIFHEALIYSIYLTRSLVFPNERALRGDTL